MKQFIYALTLLMLLAISNPVSAQNRQPLLNGNMEVWIQKSAGSTYYYDPKDWHTLNSLAEFGFSPTTSRVPDSHTGSYAALLESTAGVFANLPGLLTSNYMLDASGFPDFNLNFVAFSSRPDSLEFYVKAYPIEGDTNAMGLVLTKWDTANDTRDTIAQASWLNGDTLDQYTRIVVPFEYSSNEIPDSMSMIFSSSLDGFDPGVGTKLYVDDIRLIYPPDLSISETKKKAALNLYPNPAKDNIFISSEGSLNKFEIYDMTGRMIMTADITGTALQVETHQLHDGVYLIKAVLRNGSIATQRLVIQR